MRSSLLIALQKTMRVKNINQKVEQAYINWIKAYIIFHNKRHPQELDAGDMVLFLTHLRRSPSTSKNHVKEAINALLFMYHEVLDYSFEHYEVTARPLY